LKNAQNHVTLIGCIIAISLLVVAGLYYPGGSPTDPNSVGFSWTQNYISNMMEYKAVNGMNNPARPIAVAGTVAMGITLGLAFVRFSRKVRSKHMHAVIKYLGYTVMGISLLITIPEIHSQVIAISTFFTLLLFFYIMVLLILSRLTVFKILAVIFLAFFYGATIMYYFRIRLEYMPIVQKLIHVVQIAWILGLEYYTRREDFEHIK
jgi:hypothetical protein